MTCWRCGGGGIVWLNRAKVQLPDGGTALKYLGRCTRCDAYNVRSDEVPADLAPADLAQQGPNAAPNA